MRPGPPGRIPGPSPGAAVTRAAPARSRLPTPGSALPPPGSATSVAASPGARGAPAPARRRYRPARSRLRGAGAAGAVPGRERSPAAKPRCPGQPRALPRGAMPAPAPQDRGRCCSYRAVQKRLPILSWLPRYSLAWLQLDLIAGATVGLTVVPQALAYAEVAGLPVQYGLYSSFMGCFVYCFLGTAKDVTLGPTAIMSLLVSSYAFHDPVYAVLLAFLSGCIQLAMGLLRLGFLLDFISCPVIKGFTSAASVTIGFSQVKNFLGLRGIPRQFFLQVYETLRRIGETRAGDAILGLACLVALTGLGAMKRRLSGAPGAEPLSARVSYLIVWISATGALAFLCPFSFPRPSFLRAQPLLEQRKRGDLQRGRGSLDLTEVGRSWIPEPATPSWSCLLAWWLTPSRRWAPGRSPSPARSRRGSPRCGCRRSPRPPPTAPFPSAGWCRTWETDWPWCRSWACWRPLPSPRLLPRRTATGSTPTRSCWLWASPTSWAPSSPRTPSRAALGEPPVPGGTRVWGRRSPLCRSLGRCLCSAFQDGGERADGRLHPRGGARHRGPGPALAGLPDLLLLLRPQSGAGRRHRLRRGSRVRRRDRQDAVAGLDLVPLCVTFLLCFWEVQYGIVAGVLVSGVLLLYPIARPPIKVSDRGGLLVQPGSSLHFPAVEYLRDTLCKRALAASSPRSIVLDCRHVSSIDYTVVVGLADLLRELRKQGFALAFRGLQDNVLQVLLAADLDEFQHCTGWQEADETLCLSGAEAAAAWQQ
ncbi:sodium-independent sulfate anion transporter isoform X2 [Dromaius novaehollandiae]|uniref:sodium-independent sulfate anion transporter isoform X2 n=1 Tax=Dromaius novaehollandiae TaxID=8790 RepID=UPI00311ECA61